MAFFRNDAVNRVNLHYGVQAFAAGAGGVFYITFLIHVGLSVAVALATFAVTLAARFVVRPFILIPAKRWGLKPLVIAGTLVVAIEYVLLGQVRGLDVWLAALVAVSAVGEALYWPSYHAYFAALGDAEHRGHQIGAREALAAVVNIIAPLVGSWALLTVGPGWAFSGIAVVQALSAAPLFGAPNIAVPREAPGAYRASRAGAGLFLLDGWLGAGLYFAWQVALFVSLGRSLLAFGGAMALAALVAAVLGLFFGRHIDRGHGRRAAVVAYGLAAGLIVVRALAIGSPWLAVAANAAGAFVIALVVPAMLTVAYNLAKGSPCPLRFHIAADGGWDIGCASALLITAGLVGMGVSLAAGVLLALPACAATTWLLWRYYGEHPEAGEVEVEASLAAESHSAL
jgi:DHA1 family inner membrane transport protein